MDKKLRGFLIAIAILLISLIVSLIIFVISFKSNNGSKKIIDSDEYITKIFNKDWTLINISVYENDEVLANVNPISYGYFKFNASQVEYCTYINNECIEYDYTYKDNVVNFTNSDLIIEEGEYILNIEDDIFTLSKENENNKKVYSFGVPTG